VRPETINGDRIGIISDTHGSVRAWNSAVKLFGSVQAVLHAGDVLMHRYSGAFTSDELAEAINNFSSPVFISRGNCDLWGDETMLKPGLQPYISLLWNGRRVVMMHGDNMSLLMRMAKSEGAQLVISGHTHIAKITRTDGMIFLNPGSASRPLGKDPASAAVADEQGVSVMTFDGRVLYHEEW
jgi:putative phosphoesterase